MTKGTRAGVVEDRSHIALERDVVSARSTRPVTADLPIRADYAAGSAIRAVVGYVGAGATTERCPGLTDAAGSLALCSLGALVLAGAAIEWV